MASMQAEPVDVAVVDAGSRVTTSSTTSSSNLKLDKGDASNQTSLPRPGSALMPTITSAKYSHPVRALQMIPILHLTLLTRACCLSPL